jgi:hypothetical protein
MGFSVYCLGADFLDGSPGSVRIINPPEDPLVQLCPACGHSLQAFHSGYRGESDSFREVMCPSCFRALFRYTTVISHYGAVRESGLSDIFERYVKARGNRMFWRGDFDSGDYPSLMGYKSQIHISLDSEWHPRCPCCGSAAAYAENIDFHHWDYENDIGCQLCRSCHSYIHRGLTASEQAERTGDHWQIDAVRRLFDCTSHSLSISDPQRLAWRFNIPTDNLPAGVEAAIKEVAA